MPLPRQPLHKGMGCGSLAYGSAGCEAARMRLVFRPAYHQRDIVIAMGTIVPKTFMCKGRPLCLRAFSVLHSCKRLAPCQYAATVVGKRSGKQRTGPSIGWQAPTLGWVPASCLSGCSMYYTMQQNTGPISRGIAVASGQDNLFIGCYT